MCVCGGGGGGAVRACVGTCVNVGMFACVRPCEIDGTILCIA